MCKLSIWNLNRFLKVIFTTLTLPFVYGFYIELYHNNFVPNLFYEAIQIGLKALCIFFISWPLATHWNMQLSWRITLCNELHHWSPIRNKMRHIQKHVNHNKQNINLSHVLNSPSYTKIHWQILWRHI